MGQYAWESNTRKKVINLPTITYANQDENGFISVMLKGFNNVKLSRISVICTTLCFNINT